MNTYQRTLTIALALLLLTSLVVFAQTESSKTTSPPTAGAGILIAWWICYSARRREIGEWLLYYYLQLFGGFLFVLILFLASLRNFDPNLWEDKALYSLFLISAVPLDLTHTIEAVVGSLLLIRRYRDGNKLKLLKNILAVSIILAAVSFAIDLGNWPDSAVFDALGMMSALAWFLYFYRSKRAKMVFVDQNWDPLCLHPGLPSSGQRTVVSSEPIKKTPPQVKRLRIALIFAGILILMLIMLFLRN
jgi:uncharacterized integral membrane protein